MEDREALLNGAEQCLLSKGYEWTTVRDIATAADVSMTAIEYHFGSRDSLLQRVLFDALEDWDASLQASLAETAGKKGRERFLAVWEILIRHLRENPPLWRASFELFRQAQRSPELMTVYKDNQPGTLSAMASLASSIDEVGMVPEESHTTGNVQLARVSGAVTQWLTNPETTPSPDDLFDGLTWPGP
ncbi:TetR/AcrR family transcriptional regulator [Salininema proteolyticum]|uniref:TetR/AcrR family transcriptional regulator n=1 Tax=Salininema proteolyticum TaxID=1607685 RepID=A0ABV8U4R0_9ACTN